MAKVMKKECTRCQESTEKEHKDWKDDQARFLK